MDAWIYDLSEIQKSLPSVLLIEDDPEMRTLLLRVLEQSRRFGKILAAEDGAEGIFTARRENPDVIVLDFNLPWMNGQIAANHLRRDTIAPILVLSGEVQAPSVPWADAYVSKTELKELVPTLDGLLTKSPSAPRQEER